MLFASACVPMFVDIFRDALRESHLVRFAGNILFQRIFPGLQWVDAIYQAAPRLACHFARMRETDCMHWSQPHETFPLVVLVTEDPAFSM